MSFRTRAIYSLGRIVWVRRRRYRQAVILGANITKALNGTYKCSLDVGLLTAMGNLSSVRIFDLDVRDVLLNEPDEYDLPCPL